MNGRWKADASQAAIPHPRSPETLVARENHWESTLYIGGLTKARLNSISGLPIKRPARQSHSMRTLPEGA